VTGNAEKNVFMKGFSSDAPGNATRTRLSEGQDSFYHGLGIKWA
jgi:hypothetical protein